jgi:hypothetical protein
MRSSTTTLINALRKIAVMIDTDHGLEIDAVLEAAKRLEEAKDLVQEALERLPEPGTGEFPDKRYPLFIACLTSFLDERTAKERMENTITPCKKKT